jgi:carbon storage regulator
MLILTRRVGESVVIGDDVRVTIIAMTGTRIRAAIRAPRHVTVHRGEVYDRVAAQREQSERTSEANGVGCSKVAVAVDPQAEAAAEQPSNARDVSGT